MPNYERVYKRTQIGEKEYELFSTMTKTKRQVGTTQTLTGESERTLSVYIREEFDKADVEVWTGVITPNLKKFERQFYADLDLETGVQAIHNFYDQILKVYNGTDQVSEISERIVEFSKMAKNEKPKPLHATPH
jgi:hypothetical protein